MAAKSWRLPPVGVFLEILINFRAATRRPGPQFVSSAHHDFHLNVLKTELDRESGRGAQSPARSGICAQRTSMARLPFFASSGCESAISPSSKKRSVSVEALPAIRAIVHRNHPTAVVRSSPAGPSSAFRVVGQGRSMTPMRSLAFGQMKTRLIWSLRI